MNRSLRGVRKFPQWVEKISWIVRIAGRVLSYLLRAIMRNERIHSAFSLIGTNIALQTSGGDTRKCFEHVLHRIVQLYSTSLGSMYLRLPSCGMWI